ncbi:MAG: DeoR/GlpR transcriptional regulator [Lachnospiraceae bacterium]|jgi:Transcriptional regulators of sugar metabolism|nr:DeoR/GlpR transcriptional regulator [Lachnospiraceae bacterium]
MKNNRKAVEERHLKILNMIRERGEVKVEELAELFQISPMTVRRDMQYLEEEKLISRIHGGAVSLEKANMLLSQDEKISLCRERISEYASRFIDDGDTLFINGSRTALNMLKYAENKKVMVYTNNCWGIGEKYPDDVTIRFTGGEVRSNVMVGEYVMRNLLSMTADKTFLGCAAVYDDGEFRYDIPTEIGINEAMISRTKKALYVLADHTKIKRREALGNVYGSCVYEQSCTLITDDNANPAVVEQLRRFGIHVILVPTK